jgi:adenylyltransferase/sulfurtransferase
VGEPLSGKLVRFDALKFEFRTFNVKKDKNNPINGENPTISELIDYEAFCGLNGQQSQNGEVKEVSVSEYKDMVDRNEDHQLIDVREEYEYYITNIGGKLIPLDRIREFANEIDPDRKTVVHCRSGGRSRKAILKLQEEHGFNNLYNLKGGILAWADNIDNSVIKY